MSPRYRAQHTHFSSKEQTRKTAGRNWVKARLKLVEAKIKSYSSRSCTQCTWWRYANPSKSLGSPAFINFLSLAHLAILESGRGNYFYLLPVTSFKRWSRFLASLTTWSLQHLYCQPSQINLSEATCLRGFYACHTMPGLPKFLWKS